MQDFKQLGISKVLQNTLKEYGIIQPTPIQLEAIPVILNGQDSICQAQTGTGKTLAFMLPILESIDITKQHIQALIITPTRELALQITTETKKLTADLDGVNVLSVYGGQDVEQQLKKLKNTQHIVIATPGRLLDHLRRATIDLSEVSMLVLDEADQMLHMGFLPEVEDIINTTSQQRQTMLFSATMSQQIKTLARRYMNKPADIRIKSTQITVEEIKQLVVETTDRAKQATLRNLLDSYRPFMAIIFCRTKRRASTLNQALISYGYLSDELHGDLSQAKRETVLKQFRAAKLQLLVATDVAARGLDVDGVTHVFNYDIPQDTESYIHRIGRTGRAGGDGLAITLVAPKDRMYLDLIEKEIKMDIKRIRVELEKDVKNSTRSNANNSTRSNQEKSNISDDYQQRRQKNIQRNAKRR
jgi:ATP-dependent RNA helicase DeaD